MLQGINSTVNVASDKGIFTITGVRTASCAKNSSSVRSDAGPLIEVRNRSA